MALKISNSFMEQLRKQMEEEKGFEVQSSTSSSTKKSTKDTKETKVNKGTSRGTRANKDEKVSKDKEVDKVAKDTRNTKSKSSSKKTTSEYSPEVVREMLVKDNGRGYKEYLEVSVKRFGDDGGIPYVHFSTRVESEVYNGYKKGKHISFPLEFLYDFLDLMNEVDEECDKKHIE